MKLIDLSAYAFACSLNDPPPRGEENAATYFNLPIELRERVQAYLPRYIQRMYSSRVITNITIAGLLCYVYLIADGPYTTILVYEDGKLWMKLDIYNAVPHGKFTIYRNTGEPWHIYLYRFGKLIGHKVYFANKRRAFHRKYINGGSELGEIILYSAKGDIVSYYYARIVDQGITTVKLIDNCTPMREEFGSIAKVRCEYIDCLVNLLF